MQKGFGIAALVVSIIAFFVPLIGPWITILAGLLAIFAWTGTGFALAIAAVIVDFVNIFLSPTVWISAAASALATAETGRHFASIGGILVTLQIVAVIVLLALHFSLHRRPSRPARPAGVVPGEFRASGSPKPTAAPTPGSECAHCHAPILPDDRFCGACGVAVRRS